MWAFHHNPKRCEEIYLQNRMLFIYSISWWGGLHRNRKLGEKIKKFIFTINQLFQELPSSPTHSTLCDSETLNRRLMTSLSPAHCFLWKTAGWMQREEWPKPTVSVSVLSVSSRLRPRSNKRHIIASTMSHSVVCCSLLPIHTSKIRQIWIQNIHAPTPASIIFTQTPGLCLHTEDSTRSLDGEFGWRDAATLVT